MLGGGYSTYKRGDTEGTLWGINQGTLFQKWNSEPDLLDLLG